MALAKKQKKERTTTSKIVTLSTTVIIATITRNTSELVAIQLTKFQWFRLSVYISAKRIKMHPFLFTII